MPRRFSMTEKEYELSKVGRAALFGLISELISEEEFKTFTRGEQAIRALFENPEPGTVVRFDTSFTGTYFNFSLILADSQTDETILFFGFNTNRHEAELRSTLPKFSASHLKTYNNVFESMGTRYGRQFNSSVLKAYSLMFSNTQAGNEAHYKYSNKGLSVCEKNKDTSHQGHLMFLEAYLPPSRADDVR